MLVAAVVIFFMAERWKSQLVGGVALGLGLLAALISSGTSQHFALIALGMIAAGSGALLVRHEWRILTSMALCGTYLGTALLWFLLPIGTERGVIITHTMALLFYHAMFAAAFWKWGRVW